MPQPDHPARPRRAQLLLLHRQRIHDQAPASRLHDINDEIQHINIHNRQPNRQTPLCVLILHKQPNQVSTPPQYQQAEHDASRPGDHERPPPAPFARPAVADHSDHGLHYQTAQRACDPDQTEATLAHSEGEQERAAVRHLGAPGELQADEGACEQEELDGFGGIAGSDEGVAGPGCHC
jgi:hypothetical protein